MNIEINTMNDDYKSIEHSLDVILSRLDEIHGHTMSFPSGEETNDLKCEAKEIIQSHHLKAVWKRFPIEKRDYALKLSQANTRHHFKVLFEEETQAFIEMYVETKSQIVENNVDHSQRSIEKISCKRTELNNPALSGIKESLIELDNLHVQNMRLQLGFSPQEIDVADKETIQTNSERISEIIGENSLKAIYRRLSEESKLKVMELAKTHVNHIYIIAACKFNEEYAMVYKQVNDKRHDTVTIDVARAEKRKVKRHKAAAKKLGISLEEYEKTLSSRKPKASKAKSDFKVELAKLESQPVPEHINVIKWDDAQLLNHITTLDESIDAKSVIEDARMIERGYVTGTKESRHKTFITKAGDHMHINDIKSRVFELIDDPKMLAIEENFSTKVGNLASLPYSQWSEKVYNLFQKVEFNPDETLLKKSIDALRSQLRELATKTFGDDIIEPLNLTEGYEATTKGRNSGFPFFTPKWHCDDEIASYYLKEAAQLIEGKELDAPRILFNRTKENGAEAKMRPVECPSKSEAIAGKCFTSQIIKMFKESEQFCGFKGNTNIGAEMRKLVNENEILVSSDFSNFDTTCTHFIPIVFEIMDELFGYEYTKYFESMKHYYTNAKIFTPIGLIYANDDRTNGLQSGDSWTSVIGTLSNALANIYTLNKMGIDAEVKSYGDDCVIATNQEFSISSYEKYMAELGMECNETKQEKTFGDNRFCSFLGYYYFYEDCKNTEKSDVNLGIFPIFRALSGLVYSTRINPLDAAIEEAVQDGLSDTDLAEILNEDNDKEGVDMLGLLSRIDNCFNHKNFENFLELFTAYHPYDFNPEMVFPYRKLTKYLRQNNANCFGLGNSPTFSWLINHHDLHEKHLIEIAYDSYLTKATTSALFFKSLSHDLFCAKLLNAVKLDVHEVFPFFDLESNDILSEYVSELNTVEAFESELVTALDKAETAITEVLSVMDINKSTGPKCFRQAPVSIPIYIQDEDIEAVEIPEPEILKEKSRRSEANSDEDLTLDEATVTPIVEETVDVPKAEPNPVIEKFFKYYEQFSESFEKVNNLIKTDGAKYFHKQEILEPVMIEIQ